MQSVSLSFPPFNSYHGNHYPRARHTDRLQLYPLVVLLPHASSPSLSLTHITVKYSFWPRKYRASSVKCHTSAAETFHAWYTSENSPLDDTTAAAAAAAASHLFHGTINQGGGIPCHSLHREIAALESRETHSGASHSVDSQKKSHRHCMSLRDRRGGRRCR